MKYDVVCVGSAVLDVYLQSGELKKISSGEFEGGVALCEAFGGKTEVEDVVLTSGGGGTNSAVSFVRKGFKTAIICELGVDLIAATIKRELTSEGVDVELVVQENDEKTGISSIMVSDDGSRSLAVYRGASGMLTREDVNLNSLDTTWLYISSLGGQIDLLETLLKFGVSKEIKVALNPGKKEIEKLDSVKARELFKSVEVLLMNKEERGLLFGEGELNFENNGVWVVTDGNRGGEYWIKGKKEKYEVKEVEVKDVTGAGDAFGTGLVAGLMTGRDAISSIDWGVKQAASVVKYMGPKKGLLTRRELES